MGGEGGKRKKKLLNYDVHSQRLDLTLSSNHSMAHDIWFSLILSIFYSLFIYMYILIICMKEYGMEIVIVNPWH